MSNHVSSLVRSRNLGMGLTGKSVALLMADFASDDGSGIWASKATMAKELETTERTIQRTIKALIDAGFVAEIGRRKHRNGETYEYQIQIEAVEARPLAKGTPPTQGRPSTQDIDAAAQDMTPDTVSPPTDCHPTPDTPSPHGVTHRRPNQIEPSLNQDTPLFPKGANDDPPPKKPKRAVAIPENWVPNEANIQHALSKNLNPEEIEDEAARFRDYHLAKGTRFKDWDAGWRTWVSNSIKFRNRRMAGNQGPGRFGQGGSLASVVARRHSGC